MTISEEAREYIISLELQIKEKDIMIERCFDVIEKQQKQLKKSIEDMNIVQSKIKELKK